jgi:predicted nucleotidyltransferase
VGSPSPPLLPLLRSQVQGDLLALLYLHPGAEYSLTEVARIIGASVKTVHTEASRLVSAGFVADRYLGNVRLVRAVTDSVVARPLADLLAVTYGPLPVLTDLLGAADGVREAFIYGSWAARYSGEMGPIPNDVDVLVIGTIDLDELDRIARTAEERLRRPVSARRVRPEVWDSSDSSDPFIASVRDRPLLQLRLRESELPAE